MMLLWACAGVPLGAYNVSGGFNVALLVQPQILTVLSLITWGQCGYYDEVRLRYTVFLIYFLCVFEGVEGSWLVLVL